LSYSEHVNILNTSSQNTVFFKNILEFPDKLYQFILSGFSLSNLRASGCELYDNQNQFILSGFSNNNLSASGCEFLDKYSQYISSGFSLNNFIASECEFCDKDLQFILSIFFLIILSRRDANFLIKISNLFYRGSLIIII
jgi:hypothetical protein